MGPHVVTQKSQVQRRELERQLREIGVGEGSVLLVHTSFRAVRPVERGPQGLLEALLEVVGDRGTLVMPSWGTERDVPFDRTRSSVAPDLGVVADMFWRIPGVVRSDHLHAFAAYGPSAELITSDPLPLPPHRLESPVGRVWESDGRVLLLGVGHSANTTIHLAEVLSKVPYGIPKFCTVLENGVLKKLRYLENDHCCERFDLIEGWLNAEGLQRRGTVGKAEARLIRSVDVVKVACRRLEKDPLIFLHPEDHGCDECDLARATAQKTSI